jgi:hypothetical protein
MKPTATKSSRQAPPCSYLHLLFGSPADKVTLEGRVKGDIDRGTFKAPQLQLRLVHIEGRSKPEQGNNKQAHVTWIHFFGGMLHPCQALQHMVHNNLPLCVHDLTSARMPEAAC